MTAILFDLDGTLVDTAPDMGAALNHILMEENLPVLPLEVIRPHVSRGGLALTLLGFEAHRHEDEIEPLRLRFLDRYFEHIANHSALFDGYDDVLKKLEDNGIAWGVVTNKPGWLTDPLMQCLELAERAAVIISGDTTAERKPHPLPLQTAAERIGQPCSECLYIGDDRRDIQAGSAAGMTTVIARYGYITEPDSIDQWQAHFTIDRPVDILELINLQ